MAEKSTSSGGKKGRKFGRHARSGAQAAYNNTRRWEINAAKRQAKDKRNHGKKMKVPRGTARNERRLGLQLAHAAQYGIPSTGE